MAYLGRPGYVPPIPAGGGITSGFEKDWITLPNQLVAGAALQLTQSRDFLLALHLFGWLGGGNDWLDIDGNPATPSNPATVVSSCNAVTFGNGDNVNRITAVGDLVWSAAGNRSWWVYDLGNVSPGMQICYHLGNASSWLAEIVVFPTGWTVAGALNARPTAPNQIVIQAFGPIFGSSSIINMPMRWHFQQADDGSAFRFIACRWSYEYSWLEVQQLTYTEITPAPWVAWAQSEAGVDHYNMGLTTYNTIQRHTQNALAATALGATSARLCEPAYWTTVVPSTFNYSPLSEGFQLAPVPVLSLVAGSEGYLGVLPDVWTAGNDTTNYRVNGGVAYDEDPATTVELRLAQFGAYAFPWPEGVRPLTRHAIG